MIGKSKRGSHPIIYKRHGAINPEKFQDEVILAVDYGYSKIGLAFGRNGFVSPVRAIPAKNTTGAIHEIAKTALNHRATKIVIGLPLDHEGKETLQSKRVRKFAKLLKLRIKKPLDFFDEYGSTDESIKQTIEQGIAKKKRRVVDHFSAAQILRRYYEEHHPDHQ